jgi:hypothetical protein
MRSERRRLCGCVGWHMACVSTARAARCEGAIPDEDDRLIIRRAWFDKKGCVIKSIMILPFSIRVDFQNQTEVPHVMERDRLALFPAVSHAFQLVSNWPPTILISRPCRHDHNCRQIASCEDSRCSPSAQDSNDEMCPTCQDRRLQHQSRSK